MNQPGEVTGEKRKQMNLIQASSMETKAFNITRIKKKKKKFHEKTTKNSYITIDQNLKKTNKLIHPNKTSNKYQKALISTGLY